MIMSQAPACSRDSPCGPCSSACDRCRALHRPCCRRLCCSRARGRDLVHVPLEDVLTPCGSMEGLRRDLLDVEAAVLALPGGSDRVVRVSLDACIPPRAARFRCTCPCH